MKIKHICVPTFSGDGETLYTVGRDGVTDIRDASLSETVKCYDIFKGAQCVVSLENCPVIIEWEGDSST